jgi:O-antigen/teichoic acid export membrane protein
MIKENFLNNRLLTKNTIWNLLGNIVPLLVAIITIPILINSLGIDRFGILSLAWVIIGYFSLFDLGLGRAMTHLVAEKLGNDKEDEVPGIIWTGLIFMATLGFIAALVLATISPWLVHNILQVPPLLHQETLWSFYGLAIGMPIVVTTTGIRGVLEAKQQFGLVTIVRIPLGIFTFAGPLLVLQF